MSVLRAVIKRLRLDPTLATLMVAAFAVRTAAAYVLPTIYYPDEIYQSLEPAFRSLTGYGIETWEWREGIRSWMVAGFFRQLITFFSSFGAGRGAVLMLIAATLSLFSLTIVWVGYKSGCEIFGREAGLAVGALCALWPDFVLMGSKPLTEAMAADAVVLAAYLADRAGRATVPRPVGLFGIGVLLGLAFSIRFHIAFVLAVIAVWACRAHIRHRWLPLLAGAAAPLLVSGTIDMVTWGLPFQSIWKNFWINIVEDKSTAFGIKPPWFYFTKPFGMWGVAMVPILYGLWRGTPYRPLFAFAALIGWASFTPIGHKEFRFLFPVVPLVIILAGLGCWKFLQDWARIATKRQAATVFLAVSALLAVGASTVFQFSEYWTKAREPLLLVRDLRARSDVCGLGIVNVVWSDSGGYTHVDKPVPFHVYGQIDLAQSKVRASDVETSAFNYAITADIGPLSSQFSLLRCIGTVCLQRREGVCSSNTYVELQRLIRAAGQ
jgi:GPI mannosyltransferase 3